MHIFFLAYKTHPRGGTKGKKKQSDICQKEQKDEGGGETNRKGKRRGKKGGQVPWR